MAVPAGHVRLVNLLPHKAGTNTKVSDPTDPSGGTMVLVEIDKRGHAIVAIRLAAKLLASSAWKHWQPGDPEPIRSSLRLISHEGEVIETEKPKAEAPAKKPYVIGQPEPPPAVPAPPQAALPADAFEKKEPQPLKKGAAQEDPDAAPPAETEALYPNIPGEGEVWPAPTADMSMDYLVQMGAAYKITASARSPKQALIAKIETAMFE